jgi:hypothetical protein
LIQVKDREHAIKRALVRDVIDGKAAVVGLAALG